MTTIAGLYADMQSLRQSDNREPGTWKAIKSDGKATATVVCPDCNRSATLYEHDVAADGIVMPSLVCPYEDCNYHEHVKLEGWA